MRVLTERVVDEIIASAHATVATESLRGKVARYIELLASAGKRDPEELTLLGLAYLAEIRDGPDRRFTGC